MIKLLFRNKYLYFGAEIVCFYHRQEWITPINLLHLSCPTCCSSCSACPSRPRTTPSPPSGLLGRCGAQRWLDFWGSKYFLMFSIFRSSTWSSWQPSSPSTPWSWCLLTGDNCYNKKQNFVLKYFHFRLPPPGILFYYPGRSFHFPSTLQSYIKIINLSR